MENKIEKKPKKRGRKPKENIIINNNPVFANDNENMEDLIIKLNNNKNNDNNILYTINEFELNKDYSKSNISEVCWNCCHEFNNYIIGLPIDYNNNIFYTIGDFCSLECATRYAFNNYDNKIYEILPIINMYNNIKLGNINKINMAPDKLLLKKFGGEMDINDYRKNFNNIYYVNSPIIIPINNNIYKYELNNCNNIKDLKLYRKKKIE